MSAIDVGIALAITFGVALFFYGLLPKASRPRHRWAEVDSSDVATAMRRRRGRR